MFVLGGEGQLGPQVAAKLAGAVSLRDMCWRKLYCLPFVVFKTLKMHHLMCAFESTLFSQIAFPDQHRRRSHMSSRIPRLSSDDINHLSNGFRNMGGEYKPSHGSNHSGFLYNIDDDGSLKGWDDDDCDDNDDNGGVDDGDDSELEEDGRVGRSTSPSCNHSYDKNNPGSAIQRASENGGNVEGKKGRKSWLSMELQALGISGPKKECIGLGFAALEAAQNGGKESNGGWAPGFCTRKVKIPPHVGGRGGGSGYGNEWHAGLGHARVPQSAPVSMAIWPDKCRFSESNGGADVEGSTCKDDGHHDDGEDDDDGMGCGRLAPHEIVDREYARRQSTTFSVIEGRGRTLKGMDLRRVRNAVWSRMGFED